MPGSGTFPIMSTSMVVLHAHFLLLSVGLPVLQSSTRIPENCDKHESCTAPKRKQALYPALRNVMASINTLYQYPQIPTDETSIKKMPGAEARRKVHLRQQAILQYFAHIIP